MLTASLYQFSCGHVMHLHLLLDTLQFLPHGLRPGITPLQRQKLGPFSHASAFHLNCHQCHIMPMTAIVCASLRPVLALRSLAGSETKTQIMVVNHTLERSLSRSISGGSSSSSSVTSMHSSLNESLPASMQGVLKPEYLTDADQSLTEASHARTAHCQGLDLSNQSEQSLVTGRSQPDQSEQLLTLGQSPVAQTFVAEQGSNMCPKALQTTEVQSAKADQQQVPAQQLSAQLPGASHQREAEQSHSASASDVVDGCSSEAQRARIESSRAIANRPWASQDGDSKRHDKLFAAIEGINTVEVAAELQASSHTGDFAEAAVEGISTIAAAAGAVAAEAVAAEEEKGRYLTGPDAGSNASSVESMQLSQAEADIEGSNSHSAASSAQTKPHLLSKEPPEDVVGSAFGSDSSSAMLSSVIELEVTAEAEEKAAGEDDQKLPAEAEADLLDRDTSGLWRDVNSPVSSLGSEDAVSTRV